MSAQKEGPTNDSAAGLCAARQIEMSSGTPTDNAIRLRRPLTSSLRVVAGDDGFKSPRTRRKPLDFSSGFHGCGGARQRAADGWSSGVVAGKQRFKSRPRNRMGRSRRWPYKWKGPPGLPRRPLWLRGGDLNPRPLGYEPNELPDCSTPRQRTCRRHVQQENRTTHTLRGQTDDVILGIGAERVGVCQRGGCGDGTSRMMNNFSPGLIRPSSRRASSSMAAGSCCRRRTCS